MLRVLLYAPLVGRGGIHRIVEMFSTALNLHPDIHFRVLSTVLDEEHKPITWPPGTLIPLLDTPLPRHPSLFGFLEIAQEKFYAKLEAVAKDFDVIWCPQPWWTQTVLEWNIEAKLVATIHDFAFDQIDLGMVGERFRTEASLFSARAAHTVFPSTVQREHAIANYHFDPDKTSVIRYAQMLPPVFNPSQEQYDHVRERYGLPEKWVLAFHCAYHKGVDVILKAHFHSRRGSAYVPPLVIAGVQTGLYVRGKEPIRGEVDGHIKEIRRLISSIGYRLGKDLFILGEVPDSDIGGLYVGAKAAITASVTDAGLSGNIFEAGFSGTPIIYSDVEQFTEVLGNDGAVGFPFAPRNKYDLAKAIIEACSPGNGQDDRSARLLKRLRERRWSDVMDDYLSVFRKVSNDPASRPIDNGPRETIH